jgi:hypothetical protein
MVDSFKGKFKSFVKTGLNYLRASIYAHSAHMSKPRKSLLPLGVEF